jgi:V/A-type H+-transporting ATPase subunit I
MTLYGAESRKDAVIGRLQELGCTHLVNLCGDGNDYAPGDVSTDARDALKYLHSCREQRRQVRRPEGFDRRQVIADALRLHRERQELSDERDELLTSIEALQPWGEFALPPDGAIGDVRFQFYVVPLSQIETLPSIALPLRIISRDHRNAYVVILSGQPLPDPPGSRVELDRRPLSKLRLRLEDVEEQLEELHHQRVGLTRWCDQLSEALDEADDAKSREHAAHLTLDGNRVFALQGWIPQSTTEAIRQFARENDLAVTIEPARPRDQPPTLLENPERLAGSESLVTFYKTPQYGSWDPSIVASISFAIFFAMIVADAGYGMVMVLLTLYLWKRMGKTRAGRRGRNVLATLVGFTLFYGVLCGSYFGVSPSADSPLGKLAIIDAQSQSMMMPLTIVIGVIHLSLAHLTMAWTQRGQLSALASLGWVAVMIGATVAGIIAFGDFGEDLAGGLSRVGLVLLIGGLVAVFLFSSQRPLFSLSIKNHALRLLDGLQGLTGVSGLFGDVLSYLRLFALGLSSAKLSETFNDLGASAWDAAGFGVIVAIGIVILGHTLNLLLSIMSGVVHGLRLNCIEFFKYSLPEEGYLFKAFAKKARQP